MKTLTVVVQTSKHQFIGDITSRCDELSLKDILNRQERFADVKLKNGSVVINVDQIIWAGNINEVPSEYREAVSRL